MCVDKMDLGIDTYVISCLRKNTLAALGRRMWPWEYHWTKWLELDEKGRDDQCLMREEKPWFVWCGRVTTDNCLRENWCPWEIVKRYVWGTYDLKHTFSIPNISSCVQGGAGDSFEILPIRLSTYQKSVFWLLYILYNMFWLASPHFHPYPSQLPTHPFYLFLIMQT